MEFTVRARGAWGTADNLLILRTVLSLARGLLPLARMHAHAQRIPTDTQPIIIRDLEVWLLRVTNANGRVHEFRCATEAQAVALAAVLTQQPVLPV